MKHAKWPAATANAIALARTPVTEPITPARRSPLAWASIGFIGAVVFCISACTALSPAALPVPSPALVDEMAPTGRLRAAINFGNPLLATRSPSGGEPTGVSVDLARELGRRLGVPVDLVTFTAAGLAVQAAKNALVDIAFVAVDPVRGADIGQTAPYLVIEGAYLVKESSAIRANADVDRAGIRIVVGQASAYDLYLSREIKAATLVRAPTSPLVTDLMVKDNYEVAAGVKQQLQLDAKRYPGLRLLEGRFMTIDQAMGLPKGREAGLAYLKAFVEAVKASGFVAQAIAANKVDGATVAPNAEVPR
jgi:polar amino acid transport system substrate-binding protein